MSRASLLELRAGIGDRDEVVGRIRPADRLLDALEEVAEERVGLGRRARLRGDDEQRARDVERGVEGRDLLGVGRVEHVQRGIARRSAEGVAQGVGRQRAAAHPEHDDVIETLGAVLREVAQVAALRVRLLRDFDPAQSLLDDRDVVGLVRPRRGVAVQSLSRKSIGASFASARVGVGLRVAQRERDPRRRVAAQLLGLLSIAASIALNESANDFTPSATSSSVTS